MDNKQRALWAGLKEAKLSWDGGIIEGFNVNGEFIDLPDYPNDIAACVRDFLPKLRETGYDEIDFYYHETAVGCTIYGDDLKSLNGVGNLWSEAFTNAVDKIIEYQRRRQDYRGGENDS